MSADMPVRARAHAARAWWPRLGPALLCFAAGVAVALPLASWVRASGTVGLRAAAYPAKSGAIRLHRFTDEPSIPDTASVSADHPDDPAEAPPTF